MLAQGTSHRETRARKLTQATRASSSPKQLTQETAQGTRARELAQAWNVWISLSGRPNSFTVAVDKIKLAPALAPLQLPSCTFMRKQGDMRKETLHFIPKTRGYAAAPED